MTPKKISIISLLIAISVVLGYVVKIPTSQGMLTLMDAGVYFSALWLKDRRSAAVVGGLSGLLLDLLSGFPAWMIFSFVIHGIQGYLSVGKNKCLHFALASVVMVVGYALASGILYGWGASLVDLPINCLQNMAGIIVATLIYQVVLKIQQ